MRSVIIALVGLLFLSACGPVQLRAKDSVVLRVSEAALRGTAPCTVVVLVDGEEAFVLRENPAVRCPLPAGLLVPEVTP